MQSLFRLLWVVVPLGFLLSAWPAFGQAPACGSRTGIVSELSEKYGEGPNGMGIANNGGVIEVLVSPKHNTWSIVLTMPNGISCLIAAGENWENIPIAIKGPRL